MKQEADLVTVAEASREFRVAVSTLYLHMKTGSLTRHTRKGGRPRVFLDRRQLRALFSPAPESTRRKK